MSRLTGGWQQLAAAQYTCGPYAPVAAACGSFPVFSFCAAGRAVTPASGVNAHDELKLRIAVDGVSYER